MIKESAFDYLEDKQKVLIGRGDLFMLMHTLVAYFGINHAPVDFTVDCIQTLCQRNMYNKDLIDEFMDFQKKVIDESTTEELDKRLNEVENKTKDNSEMSATIGSVFNWLESEDEDGEKEDEQDNEGTHGDV